MNSLEFAIKEMIKALSMTDTANDLYNESLDVKEDSDLSKDFREFGEYVHDKLRAFDESASVLFKAIYSLLELEKVGGKYASNDDFMDRFWEAFNSDYTDDVYNKLLKLKEDN